jgi:hypothetical protein
MSNPSSIAEARDALDRLRAAGFGPLLDALQDPDCYHKERSGRVYVKAVAERLQVSRWRVLPMLRRARATLQ